MRYGSKILFRNVSLQLNPGNHYGPRGCQWDRQIDFAKNLSR